MIEKNNIKKPSFTLISKHDNYDLYETRAGQRIKIKKGLKNSIEDFKEFVPKEELKIYENNKLKKSV